MHIPSLNKFHNGYTKESKALLSMDIHSPLVYILCKRENLANINEKHFRAAINTPDLIGSTVCT